MHAVPPVCGTLIAVGLHSTLWMLLYSGDTPILFWGTLTLSVTQQQGAGWGTTFGAPYPCGIIAHKAPHVPGHPSLLPVSSYIFGGPAAPHPPRAPPGCEDPHSLSTPQLWPPFGSSQPPFPAHPMTPRRHPAFALPAHPARSRPPGGRRGQPVTSRGPGQDRRPSCMRHHRRHRPAPRQPGRK